MYSPRQRACIILAGAALWGCGGSEGDAVRHGDSDESTASSAPEAAATQTPQNSTHRIELQRLGASIDYPDELPKPTFVSLQSRLDPEGSYLALFDETGKNTMIISRLPVVSRPVEVDDVAGITKRIFSDAGIQFDAVEATRKYALPVAELPTGRRTSRRTYVFLDRTPYEFACAWTPAQRSVVAPVCDRAIATLSAS